MRPRYYDIDMAYERLAHQIINKALFDFKLYAKYIAKGKDIDINIKECQDIVKFIKSEYFTIICNMPPEFILKELKYYLEMVAIPYKYVIIIMEGK